jgi:hypothetical protein
MHIEQYTNFPSLLNAVNVSSSNTNLAIFCFFFLELLRVRCVILIGILKVEFSRVLVSKVTFSQHLHPILPQTVEEIFPFLVPENVDNQVRLSGGTCDPACRENNSFNNCALYNEFINNYARLVSNITIIYIGK